MVGAISSFVLARNRYASGYLAMPLSAFHFACQSHIDVKRTLSRFGSIVGDTTTRANLRSMTESSLKLLKHNVASARTKGEVACSIILDNVQQYCLVHEEGIGKENQLKVGTAGTAVYLEDCAAGAFKAQDHIDRVAKKERGEMTIDSLYADIDWTHIKRVTALHWVRVLVEFIPELQHFQTEVSAKFRSSPIAKHPMRAGRKTVVQPLGTNGEREVENQGMIRAVLDFEQQMGIGAESSDDLSWIRGDGASFAAIGRIKKYLCPVPDDFKSFRNRISTPEIWHTRATNLKTNADNHYGPSASQDPSALSKSASCAQMKRPTDTKDVNFYPTVRSMTLYWEMQVIDCWRLVILAQKEDLKIDFPFNRELFVAGDILEYFKGLTDGHLHLKLDTLIELASTLISRYASQDAYDQALSYTHSINAPADMQVPAGSPWVPSVSSSTVHVDVSVPTQPSVPANAAKNGFETKPHVEADNFDGDRVLANSILFLEDFGWWIEAAYAIPEGDMGRVNEILKVCSSLAFVHLPSTQGFRQIWIFTFAGSANQHYKDYMLEFYCLLRYEASKDLKNGILNNMLVNLTGELGKWIEGDLMQEHYNRWLEDMASKRGGEFDDDFYRKTIAPNVNHFLRIKEVIEAAFDLKGRSKTHTSPHLRDESKLLLTMYKETELHRFRSKRTMGHAAKNQFNLGYNRLQMGKLAEFIRKTTAYADIVADVQKVKRKDANTISEPLPAAEVPLGQLHSTPTSPNPDETSSESGGPSTDGGGSDGETSESSHSHSSTSTSASDTADVDVSEKQLASGSYKSMYIDAVSGKLVQEWAEEEGDDFDEDEEPEDGSQNDEEEFSEGDGSWDDQ